MAAVASRKTLWNCVSDGPIEREGERDVQCEDDEDLGPDAGVLSGSVVTKGLKGGEDDKDVKVDPISEVSTSLPYNL